MRLLNLVRHENSYSNTKYILNEALKSEKPFVLDANIIIVLAQERDEKSLNSLLFDNYFRIYDLTLYEINGLVKAKEFDAKTSNILYQFLKEINKNQIIKVPNYKTHKLYELAELLPRKIVYDAMITMKESWLQKIIEEFESMLPIIKKSNEKEILNNAFEFSKIYFNTDLIIKKYVADLYLVTASKLGIDKNKIDGKIYFNYCLKHINYVINEVRKILMRNISETLNIYDKFKKIILELKVFANKSYKQDIRFVIHSVENAINGYSLDSDVIWLYEFDFHFIKSIT